MKQRSRHLEEHEFDAAIIDLRMPGLSGWDVIEHLQQVAPQTDVIISTGHGDMDDAIRALRLGAYDFLPKPCKLVTIANVLQRVANKRALTNKNHCSGDAAQGGPGRHGTDRRNGGHAAGEDVGRENCADGIERA